MWWLRAYTNADARRDELTGLLLDRDEAHAPVQRPRATRDEGGIHRLGWNECGVDSHHGRRDAVYPGAPTSLTVGVVTTTTIPVTWTNPSGGGLLNNTVYYKSGASCGSGMTATRAVGAA